MHWAAKRAFSHIFKCGLLNLSVNCVGLISVVKTTDIRPTQLTDRHLANRHLGQTFGSKNFGQQTFGQQYKLVYGRNLTDRARSGNKTLANTEHIAFTATQKR
jgi:hypothetical protein